jgi:peptidoglycan hydrolase-like protein with peptidoglycan-binding domain
MGPSRVIIAWLALLLLTACTAYHTEGRATAQPVPLPPGVQLPALDRLLTSGDIQLAQAHLQDYGFDPGPIDGVYRAQTQAAVRAFQKRYGLPVSGLLDRTTREELVPGLDPKPTQ